MLLEPRNLKFCQKRKKKLQLKQKKIINNWSYLYSVFDLQMFHSCISGLLCYLLSTSTMFPHMFLSPSAFSFSMQYYWEGCIYPALSVHTLRFFVLCQLLCWHLHVDFFVLLLIFFYCLVWCCFLLLNEAFELVSPACWDMDLDPSGCKTNVLTTVVFSFARKKTDL